MGYKIRLWLLRLWSRNASKADIRKAIERLENEGKI